MAHLEIKTAQGMRRLKMAGEAITIGRQPDNKLVLPDELTSRHHCVIEPWEGGFRVRDLGSTHGTLLNGKPVQVGELQHGDSLEIGSQELQLIIEDLEEIPDTYVLPSV